MSKVKLLKSVIVGGLQYNMDSMVDRSMLPARFQTSKFIAEEDDPEFSEPPFDSIQEVSTEVSIEENGGEQPMKEYEIPRKKKKLIRRS
jgi:hypothetical protein